MSAKSELITNCRLICDYISFLNNEDERSKARMELIHDGLGVDDDKWKVTEKLIEKFCQKHFLLTKPVKEVHFLLIQLEKIMKEDVLVKQGNNDPNYTRCFNDDQFPMPTAEQETQLQQAIVAGLIENLARKQSIFDQEGNLITQNKARVYYESQASEENRLLRIHHSSSVMLAPGVTKGDSPEHLVYQEVYSLEQKNPVTGDIEVNYYLKGVTRVDDNCNHK